MFQVFGESTWTSKSARTTAQYPKLESTGSIGSVILGILEVQVLYRPEGYAYVVQLATLGLAVIMALEWLGTRLF